MDVRVGCNGIIIQNIVAINFMQMICCSGYLLITAELMILVYTS